MKKITATILTFACFGAFAAQPNSESGKSFSCMDKTSFEINASCMSKKIESSDSFLNSEAALFEQNANSHNAMATITISPDTLNIEVVAHKDAYLAKLNRENK
jgi:uncharacterized protein YecT (DUF1311 family)